MQRLIVSITLFPSILFADISPIFPELDMAIRYTKSWHEVSSRHFTIIFPSELDPFALNLLPQFESVHNTLAPRYGQFDRQTTVILLPNIDDFNAFAIAHARLITLFLQQPREDMSEEIKYAGDILHTFVHEYTHILQQSVISGFPRFIKVFFPEYLPQALLPTWFVEGWATQQESEFSYLGRVHSSFTQMLLRTDLMDGRLISLTKLNTEYSGVPRGGDLVYLYGASFLNYVYQQDPEKFFDMIHYLGKKATPFSLDTKSQKVLGKPLRTLYLNWESDLLSSVSTPSPDAQQIHDQAHNTGASGEKHDSPTAPQPQADTETKKVTTFTYRMDHPRRDDEGNWYYIDKSKRAVIKITPSGEKSIIFSVKHTYRQTINQFELLPSSTPHTLLLILTETSLNGIFSDLYRYNRHTKTLSRLTVGQRINEFELITRNTASQLYIVKNELTQRNIHHLDLATGNTTRLTHFGPYTQIMSLALSPDGEQLAFIRYDPDQETYNLYVMDRATLHITQITHDMNIQTDIAWRDNTTVLFTADYGAIFNIYAYTLTTHAISQLTDVKTGAFNPAILKDLTHLTADPLLPSPMLYYTRYTGTGFDLEKMPISDRPMDIHAIQNPIDKNNTATQIRAHAQDIGVDRADVTPYQTLKRSVLPNEIIPYLSLSSVSNESNTFGILLDGYDPLIINQWLLVVGYSPDLSDVDIFASYTLNYFRPRLTANYARWGLILSDIYATQESDNTVQFSDTQYREKIWFGNAGFTFPFTPDANFSLFYSIQNHNEVSERPADVITGNIPGDRRFAGIRSAIAYTTPYHKISLIHLFFRDELASELNQDRIIGWYKYTHPFDDVDAIHSHVTSLLLHAGVVLGEKSNRPVFFLGNDYLIQNSPFTDILINFRGYTYSEISGNRFLKGSLEYDIPIVDLNYGVGYHLFFKDTTVTFFTDYGDAFEATPHFEDFKWSAGSELKINFNIMSRIPLEFLLGYAYKIPESEHATYLRVNSRF